MLDRARIDSGKVGTVEFENGAWLTVLTAAD